MGASARPGPALRAGGKAGPYRVEFHSAGAGEQIRLVHDAGVEAALPEVAAPALTPVHLPGVAPVRLAERRPQTVRRARPLRPPSLAGQ